MLFDRELILKTMGKRFHDRWRRSGKVNDPNPTTYFDNALNEQSVWLWLFSFLLTIIAASAAFAFIGMLPGFDSVALITFIIGGSAAWLNEKRSRKSTTISAGDSDGLLMVTGTCAIVFFPAVFHADPGFIYWSVSGMVVFAFLSWRYYSSIAICAVFTFFTYLLFMSMNKLALLSALPFASMAVFGFIYFSSEKFFLSLPLLWKPKVLVIRTLSLIMLLLSGNYYVVRVLSSVLLDHEGEIDFAYFFFAYSTLLPLAFICYSLKRKLRTELAAGIFSLAAGLVGIRQFHFLMEIEYALLISGALLFSVGYLAARLLKKPWKGIYAAHKEEDSGPDSVKHFVIGLVLRNDPSPAKEVALEGGGEFGGGGAGSKF